MTNTHSEKIYTLNEVSELLGVSERTVFRYIHSGKLKARKIGGWKISEPDLRSFLNENSSDLGVSIDSVDTKHKKGSLTKSDIKRVCDILRRDDGVGAKDYIEQFSWLLFLKVFEGVESQLKELEEAEGRKYKPVIDTEY